MLDLAKVESGKMEFRFQPMDLAAVVTPVVLDERLIASRKDILISFDVQKTPAMMGDEEKLSQVVTNLLSNAVKYTDPGGLIAVLLYPKDHWIVLRISDNGVGIPREALPNLFTKFYQAPNLDRKMWKGTGLGLAIVKAYTEGHKGIVTVDSAVGKGTTFELKFPAITSREQPGPQAAADDRVKSSSPVGQDSA
jgi:two-component system sensor histidine kinase GlrK